MTRILVLGGTTEASQLASAMAAAGLDGIFSYAGRTEVPLRQALPVRVGGFGGIPGLVKYLQDETIGRVIDATHPFAAQMSAHAIAACAEAGVPLLALERPPWAETAEDLWIRVPDIAAAVHALPQDPQRVFLAIGRQNLEEFTASPQHHYLLRLVDAPDHPPLPRCEIIVSRGPFTLQSDLTLLLAHRIQLIVSKNSGGSGAAAKLEAARQLRLPVVMIDRPVVPERCRAGSVAEVLAWLGHPANLGV